MPILNVLSGITGEVKSSLTYHLPSPRPRTKVRLMSVFPPIPVWETYDLDFDLIVQANASGTVGLQSSFEFSQNILAGFRYTPSGGIRSIKDDSS